MDEKWNNYKALCDKVKVGDTFKETFHSFALTPKDTARGRGDKRVIKWTVIKKYKHYALCDCGKYKAGFLYSDILESKAGLKSKKE